MGGSWTVPSYSFASWCLGMYTGEGMGYSPPSVRLSLSGYSAESCSSLLSLCTREHRKTFQPFGFDLLKPLDYKLSLPFRSYRSLSPQRRDQIVSIIPRRHSRVFGWTLLMSSTLTLPKLTLCPEGVLVFWICRSGI